MFQVQAKSKGRWIPYLQAHDYARAISLANGRFAQFEQKHSFRVVSPRGDVVYRMAA